MLCVVVYWVCCVHRVSDMLCVAYCVCCVYVACAACCVLFVLCVWVWGVLRMFYALCVVCVDCGGDCLCVVCDVCSGVLCVARCGLGVL